MSDLTPYTAYELVDLKGRAVLTAPAPGLAVYLASEVNRLEIMNAAVVMERAQFLLEKTSLEHDVRRLEAALKRQKETA